MAFNNGYTSGPQVIRLDVREEPRIVEAINRSVPPNIYVQKKTKMSDYRRECLEGEEHPLSVEAYEYSLVKIFKESIDTTARAYDISSAGYNSYARTFNQLEMEFITGISKRPEVEWALDNSFDGLYISRYEDPGSLSTMFMFAVYLKRDHATFWKLKFGGQAIGI